MKRSDIEKAVQNSILEFILGVNDTIIGNVSLCWHGECGSFSEASVVICNKEEDGRFHEVNGVWIDLEEYVTKYKHSRWFKELTKDILEEVMERYEPDETDRLEDMLEEMRHRSFDIGKPKYREGE